MMLVVVISWVGYMVSVLKGWLFIEIYVGVYFVVDGIVIWVFFYCGFVCFGFEDLLGIGFCIGNCD